MKKTLILTFAIAATALFSSCGGGETKKRPWDKDAETESTAETVKPVAAEEIKMEDIPAGGSAQADLGDYTNNANYRKLMSIGEKCNNPNFEIEDLSQSDFAFMISYCNMMLDAAEEADSQGTPDQFVEEYSEFIDLVEGFVQLLEFANTQNLLDSSNSHDYALLMRRAERAASL